MRPSVFCALVVRLSLRPLWGCSAACSVKLNEEHAGVAQASRSISRPPLHSPAIFLEPPLLLVSSLTEVDAADACKRRRGESERSQRGLRAIQPLEYTRCCCKPQWGFVFFCFLLLSLCLIGGSWERNGTCEAYGGGSASQPKVLCIILTRF